MALNLSIGKPGDLAEIIACADQCFGFTTEQTSFRVAGAKFYGEGLDTSDRHLLVREDGHLLGLVGLCPERMLVGERTLFMAGIGTVCTKPEARGRGVMQMMLNGCNDMLEKWDCDLAFLAGKYERYHHFGYELAGSSYSYRIARKDAKQELELRPMQADDATLPLCLALQEREEVRVKRDLPTYYGLLTQWGRRPYGLWRDDKWLGYLTYHEQEHSVEEIELVDWTQLDAVLQTVMWQLGTETLSLVVPAYRKELCLAARTLGEKSKQPLEIMLQIRRFDKLLNAFLALKEPLPNGAMVLDVTDRQRLLLEVSAGRALVTLTDKPADLTLDWADATRLLFGALDEARISEEKRAFCGALFPLDWALCYGDQF